MSDSEKARMIIEIVCDYNLITLDEMMQRKRDRRFAEPRQQAAYLIRKHTQKSLHDVGALLGLDHATIIYGCNHIADLIKYNGMGRHIAELEEMIYALEPVVGIEHCGSL